MNTAEIKNVLGVTPCPNPAHYYQVGKTTITWRWASDYWSTVEGQNCYDDWFSISRFRSVDGFRGGRVIIWKFIIMWGRFVGKVSQ